MNSNTPRNIETEIEIDAPAEAVWKALTDAEELTNWFPTKARIEPGLGGKIWVSWNEHTEFTTPITGWEENRYLKQTYCEAVTGDAVPAGGTEIPFPITVEYFLEARGGTTVIRLVHSGFSRDTAWDNQYDGTVRGWAFELGGLKHYLEHHRGTKRVVVHAVCALDGIELAEAWAALMSPRGLLAEGTLDGLGPCRPYAVTTAEGDRLEGTIVIHNPPKDLAATVRNLNNAYLRIRVDHGCHTAPQDEANIWISTYGMNPAAVGSLQQRFDNLIHSLFARIGA